MTEQIGSTFQKRICFWADMKHMKFHQKGLLGEGEIGKTLKIEVPYEYKDDK